MASEPSLKAVPTYRQINGCRACHSGKLSNVLSLGDQYVVNFVKTKDETLPRAPLELVVCNECGLLQLKHSVDPALMWGENYWYRSSVNQTMRDALVDVVNEAVLFHAKGTWLDIGANDGWLLSRVPETFRKIACEPAQVFKAELEELADLVYPHFFSDNIGEKCDIITSCACFYDVDDPGAFIGNVKKLLTKDGVWINQLSNTHDMLDKTAFDNVCHEHRLYLDLATLQGLYAKHDLAIVKVSHNDVNGGSIRVIARHKDSTVHEVPLVPPIARMDLFAFAERVRRWKQKMQEILDAPGIAYNSQWCYGASTKGIVLLQHLDRSDRFLAVADRNPKKHGLFMVGSWLPIVSEAELRQAQPRSVLVLPWAFRAEFMERERELRATGTSFIFPLPTIEVTI